MSQPTPRPTVTLPLVGTVQRRWVYVGVGAVALVVGYSYLAARRRAQTGPVLDPSTGALADSGAYINPNPGAEGSSSTVDSTPDSIDTNDAWVRVVLADLAGLDWPTSFAASALGKYLAGAPVTTDELNLIRTAWGLRGKPPQGAPEPLLAPSGGPPSTPPTDQPIKATAFAGTPSDEWINAQTATYGTYWNQLVLWNPGIAGNVTKDKVPANRKFIRTETYIVKK